MKTQQQQLTLEQLTKAHSKVKSGADFPKYILDLKELGVIRYETFVTDGHTVYVGKNDYKIKSLPKYNALSIAKTPNKEQFLTYLKTHQQGNSDYSTFCKEAAHSGVLKWVVRMSNMTCTYFDSLGNNILVEKIPGKDMF